MITCPECGQAAPDDAKFCDRCGQGLLRSVSAPSSPTRPTPLAKGAMLKGGIEIVELIGQTSIENRYRAKQTSQENSGTATITLRERLGPANRAEVVPEPAPAAKDSPPQPIEDPNGPRAKAAELRPSNKNGTPSRPAEAPVIERAESAPQVEASAQGGESGIEVAAIESSSPTAELDPEALADVATEA